MHKQLLAAPADLEHWQTWQIADKGGLTRIKRVKAEAYPAVLVWTWEEVPHNSSDWLEWEMVYPADFQTPA
jgi:hypothetical protein